MTSLGARPAHRGGGPPVDVPASVLESVRVLLTLTGATSVVDLGSEDPTWAPAFAAAGVTDVLLVRPPLHPALAAAGAPTLGHDLRLPLQLNRRFDLAVAVGAGEHLPPDTADVLARTLCDAAGVVAFAAAMPGVAPPGAANVRWPAWWDSVFEAHGYVAHDVARPLLWERESIGLDIRQGLVLYAPEGRFTPVGLPPRAQRSAVHPETYHVALTRAEARRRSETAMAAAQSLAIEGELVRLADVGRRLDQELEAERSKPLVSEERPSRAELSEALAAIEVLRSDNVLLSAAVAATERELAGRPRVTDLAAAIRQGPVSALVRALTRAVPLRHGLRHLIGPTAPLWDEDWYLARSPDVLAARVSPLWHYRRFGAALLRSPHPWFDPEWYVARNPAVLAQGHDPVEHYLRVGWREGRDPHPLFSTSWYGDEHASRDRWRRSPLEHYLERGRESGLSPHPLFDSAWYLDVNPDVRAAGEDAPDHFSRRGWREGRDPHPLFDVRWYLENNPDVAHAGVNPLVHYLWSGWREDRDPHPMFDVSSYLEANRGVRESGTEPLTHYLTSGAAEGLATGPFDTAWYVARHPEAAEGSRNPLVFFVRTGCPRGDSPRAQPGS